MAHFQVLNEYVFSDDLTETKPKCLHCAGVAPDPVGTLAVANVQACWAAPYTEPTSESQKGEALNTLAQQPDRLLYGNIM